MATDLAPVQSEIATEIPKQKVLPLERRNARDMPYEVFMRDYVAKNKPVVVEDAVRDWPALKKWTPEFFKTQFGPKQVNVGPKDKQAFGDFIDAVLASTEEKPGPYMFRLFVGPHMPELLQDLQPQNDYAFPRRLASPLMPKTWRRPDGYLKLLIGGVGGKFPVMHFDGENMHACITEIYGDKEFIMFAPEDTPYVYRHDQSPMCMTSQIEEFANPDYKRFPLFAKATRYHTILRPGEMIFVPSRWWHTARVVSTSISICQNMLDSSNWKGYVNWLCHIHEGKKALKKTAARAYFNMLGGTLSLLEKMPMRGKKAKHARAGRIARLAPTSTWEAMDVSEWPINKWIVR
jgi:hypothetical protein